MIVVDASAMVEALVGAAPTDELLTALEGDVHAPTLLDVEVMSALRGLELGAMLSPTQAADALDTYWSFSIQRHEARLLRHRVWQLRHQCTSYDTHYIALAEALDAPLYTCDRKLAARGHSASILVQH
ncbi:type II toxin-antitoxin system VapC family toxin [uncultured Tessaracoccus sp.]|uniref:type II toxin-antitoxin system VapC family toxin n=1 Tax=uncultured Tessaracoccus sp. TaxID=905023 RepID=UPI002632E5A6|nr:type II toxin-antitoxin system VapC family toxin [uncultured Tessaracoccus sp.]